MQSQNGIPIFGTVLPGVKYEPRPGAYAFIYDTQDRIAVVQTSFGLFLPGGGLDAGESDEQALTRELLEEIGYRLLSLEFLFKASQFHWSEHYQKHFQKVGAFFNAEAEPVPGSQMQAGHSLLWLNPEKAQKSLSQEFQRWALTESRKP